MRELSEGKKALAAISGGVDSTISALLARQALGERVFPVLIDTGFMREDEPEKVRDKLAKPPLELKIRIVRSAGRFLKAVADEPLAEEKRKKFRETFYQVFKEEADKFGCEYLVQGTIAPDWIETQGGIKTQHNVLEQVGINPHARYGFKLLEPLSELYKDQVRSLAKYLAVPNEFSERQPFPGPGLLVRCIGEVKKSKLETLSGPCSIVEGFKEITRVAVLVKDRRGEGQYSILIRAVSTRDYMTASVTPISWKTLKDTAEELLKSSERIGRVYYDITPKPPATIEFE